MMMGRVEQAGFAFLLAGVLSLAASPLAAQDRGTDCRCVDRDGTELENCICVRTPHVDRIVMGSFPGAERPRLGISVDVSDPSDEPRGARISDVMPDGPAEQAGLAEGDVITHVDGRSLLEPLDADRERELDQDRSMPAQRLLALARQLEPGDQVEIDYLRGQESRRATVEAEDLTDWGRRFAFTAPEWDAEAFGERMRSMSERMRGMRAPNAPGRPGTPGAPPPERFRVHFDGREGGGAAWFGLAPRAAAGLEMVALNPELGGYFGAERGVLVTAVESENGLGLRAGDVILEVDGRAVEEPGRVRAILATYEEDEPVAFRIRRDGREIDVTGRTGG